VRRSYEGAAQAAALTSALGNSTADLVIQCGDLTNWPTGTGGYPFFVVIDRGKAAEEKILCASRSGNTIAVYDDGITNGRGADDTSITSHGVNAEIEHIFTATDADEANAHVNATTGVHGISGSVVGTTGAQTLTNKTISGSSNTLSNIAQASVTSLTTDLAAKADLSLTSSTKTANYTLVLGDAGESIEMNVASANTLTVPLNSSVAFPLGTTILIIQVGAGQTTVTPTAGVTINSTPGLKLRTQWSVATLIKRGTDAWVVAGDVVA
jgi:hypothetical protein